MLNYLFLTPIIFFCSGILLSQLNLLKFKNRDFGKLFAEKINSILTPYLLFCIGLKGGFCLVGQSHPDFFSLLGILILWGIIEPFISYKILKKFTSLDSLTAVAISACFGSVSLITFSTGVAFLEKLHIPYNSFVIPILPIMELPAIISGFLILSWKKELFTKKNIWIHTLFNKSVIIILLGILSGIVFSKLKMSSIQTDILFLFKPCLYFFLYNMGYLIHLQKNDLKQFSWSLTCFGCYMPLISGIFGILIGAFLKLDLGTTTLIATLTASASYIAVPAVFKMALPQAKESIYLPLSLGITFPFNILIGIPVFHFLALKFIEIF